MRSRAEVLTRLDPARPGLRGVRLATVSGVLTTRPALIRWVDRTAPGVELITTKSYQVRPNPGYREPVVVETAPGCFGNAVGLRNPGMEEGFRELQELRRGHRLRALLCVSLSASSVEDFTLLARRFGPVADLLELNFSCPHARAGYGAAIGQDPGRVADYVQQIRRVTDRVLIAKLTPNVTAIGPIARAAVNAGADGISAINTVGPEIFREADTGLPILGNPNGGRGGLSGEWIKATALARVAEIRAAVGPRVPIVGMGGVSTARDVLAMRAAGADLVGLGSVLARVPRQDLIPLFFAALQSDCLHGTDTGSDFLSRQRLMHYRPLQVAENREVSPNLHLLSLEGELPALPGQFAFLYVPGVGEKPFSVAAARPLQFVVRRRGAFTQALCALSRGERLLARGPYGAEAPAPKQPRVVILAGGTGIAVGVPLARSLRRRHLESHLYFAASRRNELAVAEMLSPELPWRPVADEGTPARVLERLGRDLGPGGGIGHAFYAIGPDGFLERAALAATSLGADPREVYLCLETPSLCGVGLCGSCECGGRLLCKEGTFVSLEALQASGAGPVAAPPPPHEADEEFIPAGARAPAHQP